MSDPLLPSGLPPGAILASGLRHVDAVLQALPPDKQVAVVTNTHRSAETGELVTRTGVAWRITEPGDRRGEWAFAFEHEARDHWRKHGGSIGLRWTL